MIVIGARAFTEVWAIDFEFGSQPGELPEPRCVCAKEIVSGREHRRWLHDERPGPPPYPVHDPDALVICFFASAELSCHHALGWPPPVNLIDCWAEFRNLTNGRIPPKGAGLLAACSALGIDVMDAVEKSDMRDLALRGGAYSAEERVALLNYNAADVRALERVFWKLRPHLDERALLRGRYSVSVAAMEAAGIPIDTALLVRARENWEAVRAALIEEVDGDFGVYDGTRFTIARFENWVTERGLAWPRTPTGRFRLDDESFEIMVGVCPSLRPLRDLRRTLAQLRVESLAVGSDGRNRALLSPFGSLTGRNAPGGRLIFTAPSWLRGLIRPEPGMSLAYIDWQQEEFGVAAALSQDAAMMDAYSTGDPYLAFAAQAGAVPPGATKASHPAIREKFKVCSLGVLFGMWISGLALRLGVDPAEARELLDHHHRVYRRYWRWSDDAVSHARLRGEIHTTFGWRVRPSARTSDRTLRNWPIQSNGAELMRLAAIFATEMGVRLVCPVHDAFLVEAPREEIQQAKVLMVEAMNRACDVVLQGFRLRTDTETFHYPDRWPASRTSRMWRTFLAVLERVEGAAA